MPFFLLTNFLTQSCGLQQKAMLTKVSIGRFYHRQKNLGALSIYFPSIKGLVLQVLCRAMNHAYQTKKVRVKLSFRLTSSSVIRRRSFLIRLKWLKSALRRCLFELHSTTGATTKKCKQANKQTSGQSKLRLRLIVIVIIGSVGT